MSSGEPNIKLVTFDDVKELKDDKSKLLIDVREPSELQETGELPGSINIPLSEVENTLKNTSADDFMDRYGRPKPDLSSPLVFSCRAGGRSKKAAETAAKLGFEDVSSYSGGWLDWEEKTKQ